MDILQNETLTWEVRHQQFVMIRLYGYTAVVCLRLVELMEGRCPSNRHIPINNTIGYECVINKHQTRFRWTLLVCYSTSTMQIYQHVNRDEMRSKQLNDWLPRINIRQWHRRKYSYLSTDCMWKQYEVAGVSVIEITEYLFIKSLVCTDFGMQAQSTYRLNNCPVDNGMKSGHTKKIKGGAMRKREIKQWVEWHVIP